MDASGTKNTTEPLSGEKHTSEPEKNEKCTASSCINDANTANAMCIINAPHYQAINCNSLSTLKLNTNNSSVQTVLK